MLDKINIFKQDKNKKDWKPYHEELFSNLTANNIDDSIKPYIELLKTSDFKKAMKKIKGGMHLFDNNEFIESSFKKFVDYLLENNRYKELFAEGMKKNVLKGENSELYNEVYETTLGDLTSTLDKIKNGKASITPFFISQIIKTLRGELFIFKLGEGFVWFEKSYLFDEDAKQINEDHSDKPVYGYRMHVGENASIYSLDSVLKSMNEFLNTTETGAQPYIGLRSWLLDTEFVKYRLKNKKKGKWSDEKIENFMKNFYGRLGTITPEEIKDEKSYNRISRRIKNHLRDEDKALIDAYKKEGKKIVEGKCLLDLNKYCKNN